MTLVLCPLVVAYYETGATAQAGELADRLLRLADTVEDPATVATMYVNVARVQHGRGDAPGAERSLTQAERIFAQLDRPGEVGIARLAHGLCLARRNDPGARKMLGDAAAALQEANNEIEAGNALVELGRLERQLGNPDVALQRLDEGLALVRGRDDGDTAEGLREKARVMLERDPSLAQKYAEEALGLWERIGVPDEIARTRALLGRIFEAGGDRDAAYEQFRMAALAERVNE